VSGIGPESEFSYRYKLTNDDSRNNSEGMVLVSELDARASEVSEVDKPNSLGMFPVSELAGINSKPSQRIANRGCHIITCQL
jgi:hypothetical protein